MPNKRKHPTTVKAQRQWAKTGKNIELRRKAHRSSHPNDKNATINWEKSPIDWGRNR